MNRLNGLPWGLDFGAPTEVELEFDQAGGLLTARVANNRSQPFAPGPITVRAAVDLSTSGGFLLAQGDGTVPRAFVHQFGEPAGASPERDASPSPGVEVASWGVLALCLPVRSPAALLIGALAVDSLRVEVRASFSQDEARLLSLEVEWDLEAAQVPAGGVLELPAIVLAEGGDAWTLASEYASRVATHSRVGVRQPAATVWRLGTPPPAAPNEALRNVEWLRNAGFPGDFVLVGHSPQTKPGDMPEANGSTAGTPASHATEIRNTGLRPALAMAPLLLHEGSKTLLEHPDYAVHDQQGDVVLVETEFGRCAMLDVTLPSAQDWLARLVETAVHGWGYECLQLDGLASTWQLPAGARYSESAISGTLRLREALKIIRKAAGQTVTLIGNNCPFGSAVGILDWMMTAPAAERARTVPSSSLPAVAGELLLRGWMHGHLWTNAAGPLLAGSRERTATESEFRLLATAVALSGGAAVFGDDLAGMSEQRQHIALALLPPSGVAARPAGAMDGPCPPVWRADMGDGRHLVGVFNWTQEPRWIRVTELLWPGETAFDVWRRASLGKGDVLLQPNEGTLWQVASPRPTPRVVGDSGHVGFARLYQRLVSGQLQVRNDSLRERTVAVEARGRVIEVELEPSEARWFS